MNNTVGVAGIQMEIFPGPENIGRMAERLRRFKAESPKVDLVFFSELSLFGREYKYAQSIPGPATEELCRLAADTGLWLLPGSLHEPGPGGVFNSAPVINPEGQIVSVYRKLFPWRPMERAISGTDFCVFEGPGGIRMGLCICYDQWFPEVARQLVYLGAEVILNPVMTTTADRELELVLCRANAIAQQVYFLSINGLGHGGNGRSIFVGPEGDILAEAGESEAVLAVQLEMERVRRAREIGTLGLCQVLKSFRDDYPGFSVYTRGPDSGPGWAGLGPMTKRRAE